MPAAPALDRLAPRARARGRFPILAALGALLTAAALVASDAALADPDRVDVAIQNSTAYELTVRARSPGGDAVLLGPIDARSTKQVSSVIDRGPSWVLEFSYGGVSGPPLEVSRAELVSGPVEVSSAVGDRLRRAGLPAAGS